MTKRTTSSAVRQGAAPIWATRDQLRYLSRAEVLEELGPAGLARAIILLLAVTVFCAVAWASMATLQQTAKASGEVVPQSPIRTIEHAEGGTVVEVLVREGAVVRAGDVLVRLSPTSVAADLETAEARRIGLLLRIERLRAFADGRQADFIDPPAHFAALVDDQRDILEKQRDASRRAQDVLRAKLAQEEGEVAALQAEARKLAAQLPLLSELLGRQKRLLAEGLASRATYLESERELMAKRGELEVVRAQIGKSEQAIATASAQIEEYVATERDQALKEMGAAAAELAEVEQTMVRLRDRVDRLDIVAPLDGVIQSLEANAVGRVVAPGNLVAQVVPIDDELVVEARIDPSDAGQVRPGDAAEVRFTTYDHARLGGVGGTVERISATTFRDEDGAVYYKALIQLERSFVDPVASRFPVLPGLLADVEIKGKSRTVLQYLMHPIFRSLDVALTEK